MTNDNHSSVPYKYLFKFSLVTGLVGIKLDLNFKDIIRYNHCDSYNRLTQNTYRYQI